MGSSWKVKSARIKGEKLVIVAEKEIPLAKILSEVLEGETEPEEEEVSDEDEEEVSDEEARKRPGISTQEQADEVMEHAEKIQDQIEEVEMETGRPVSKLKGQKGRILASVDNGNETLAEIAEETGIGQASVSTQLTWLTKNSFTRRVDRGHYKITARGKTYLKKLEAVK